MTAPFPCWRRLRFCLEPWGRVLWPKPSWLQRTLKVLLAAHDQWAMISLSLTPLMVVVWHRSSRNGVHQHGMLRAAEVSQQLCRKLKRLGLRTDSSCEGDVDQVRATIGSLVPLEAGCIPKAAAAAAAHEPQCQARVFILMPAKHQEP
jgi:hypothetical protein